MRLTIGGPTRDNVPAAFADDLAELYAYTREMGPWGRNVTTMFMEHTYIHCGRELVLEAVLKEEQATHLLWLDTDMTFPRTAAVQLVAHDQPIVGCNYMSRRQNGSRPTARRGDERVRTERHSTGLEVVDEIGFGVVLMRTDIIADMARPWFRHGLNDLGGDIGEDIMFCRRLREAGHTIYIDHDLSKQVGHIGQYTYRTLEAEAVPV